MSNLRIFGLSIGVVGLLLGFFVFRGHRWNRFNFVFSELLSLSLVIACVNPDVLNSLRNALSLANAERGRILLLLIASNIVVWVILLYFKNSFDRRSVQFDQLIRKLGEEEGRSVVLDPAFRSKEVAVLIPAFNEAENLDILLPGVFSTVSDMEISLAVLVVDDGSSDATAKVARKHNAWVVLNKINRGGGAALRLGYDIIKKAGIPICVTMDADCQHRPEDIPAMVQPIVDGEADIVIGSRLLGKQESDSSVRLAGIYFFNCIVSFLTNTTITDCSTGFRAFRMERVSEIRLKEDQYHTAELIIEAAKKGFTIKEIPITILTRKRGQSKKGSNWTYGFNFARTIIKSWWR